MLKPRPWRLSLSSWGRAEVPSAIPGLFRRWPRFQGVVAWIWNTAPKCLCLLPEWFNEQSWCRRGSREAFGPPSPDWLDQECVLHLSVGMSIPTSMDMGSWAPFPGQPPYLYWSWGATNRPFLLVHCRLQTAEVGVRQWPAVFGGGRRAPQEVSPVPTQALLCTALMFSPHWIPSPCLKAWRCVSHTYLHHWSQFKSAETPKWACGGSS